MGCNMVVIPPVGQKSCVLPPTVGANLFAQMPGMDIDRANEFAPTNLLEVQ